MERTATSAPRRMPHPLTAARCVCAVLSAVDASAPPLRVRHIDLHRLDKPGDLDILPLQHIFTQGRPPLHTAYRQCAPTVVTLAPTRSAIAHPAVRCLLHCIAPVCARRELDRVAGAVASGAATRAECADREAGARQTACAPLARHHTRRTHRAVARAHRAVEGAGPARTDNTHDTSTVTTRCAYVYNLCAARVTRP